MDLPRVRPEFDADERTQLVGWLDMQRAIIHWKCADVTDEDSHRSVLPDSPVMTMAGLVSHLRWTEHCWFDVFFLGTPSTENPQFRDPDDADWMADDIPLATLLEDYQRQCARSNEIVAAHALEDVGRNREFGSDTPTLRWITFHMLEETARHAGHADTVRELLDGSRGYY